MTIGSIIIIFATLLLAESVVPIILGQEYTSVAAYLIPLTLSLLAVVLGSVARLLSLVFERPRHVFLATIMELAVFWAVAIPLISWKGGIGASVAFFAASTVYGGYMTHRLQREALYSLKAWFAVILTAAIFSPLVLLRSTIWVNILLFVGFMICYSALLIRFELVSKDEAVTIWQALISTRTPDTKRAMP